MAADDEAEIRTLITRWAKAVHEGDLATVLERHADDIVMFDVPPPDDGIRGIAAYRESWLPFFDWQSSGACFDIVGLDVVAGSEVAYAFALLKCARPEELEALPEVRLRLTLGLRKTSSGWVVGHEHHSFPDRTGD